MSLSRGLQPKHYKALELWEEGLLSIKEIAKAVKISEETMYDLFEGNAEKLGETAHLFKAELEKITARTAVKIKHLTKDSKMLALYKIDEFLRNQQKKPANEAMMKELVKIMNSLNKASPGVEVGSISITKGMTKEDLRDEFKRLTALARHALDGGRVSGPKPQRPGRLPDLTSGRDPIPED
jgi:exonuclease VII small subunit